MEFSKEPNKRVKLARELAGYKTPSEAARQVSDINVNTLISAENGNRMISKKAAQKFATAFNVTPQWILYGDSSDEIENLQVPLVSSISATSLQADTFENQDAEKYNLASLPRGNHIALRVKGRSMDRIAPEGSILIVNLDGQSLVDKGFYIFSNENEHTFKRFRTNPSRLEPYSTLNDYETIFTNREPVPIGRVIRVILDLI